MLKAFLSADRYALVTRRLARASGTMSAVGEAARRDERLLGSFPVMRGPRFGIEGLFSPLFVISSMVLLPGGVVLRAVIAVGLGTATLPLFNLSRSWWTVALTDRNVVLMKNRRFRSQMPETIHKRLPTSGSLSHPPASSMEPKITVGAWAYWVGLNHRDEAARLARLA